MATSVLFIGGTGTISSACVRQALAAGLEVTVLNRGRSTTRPLPEGVRALRADVGDPAAVEAALAGASFDVVAQFLGFTPDQVEADLARFAGRVGQYVFVSSASAYAKPVTRLPLTESSPLANPFWQYSRDKIACEDLLVRAFRERGFPATIVRPSHTYDAGLVPLEGGWTVVERMRQGEPVVVHGDGTSLWVLTHADDLARAFVALLGDPAAHGETYHITGDELLTWDAIHRLLAAAAGVSAPTLVHVASETIAEVVPEWGPSLLGDKAHSVVFDTTKIRRAVPGWQATVPFRRGAEEIVAWHDALASRRRRDPGVDAAMDALLAKLSRTLGR